jgi:hypothetical protein
MQRVEKSLHKTSLECIAYEQVRRPETLQNRFESSLPDHSLQSLRQNPESGDSSPAGKTAATVRVTASTRSSRHLCPPTFCVTSMLACPVLSRVTSGRTL